MAETLAVTDMLPNKFEPKRQFRWVLAIEGIDAFIIKTASRPNISIEEVEIPYINHKRFIAGKASFETLSVTLHDPIAPSGAQQVMEWVRTHFESVSGRAGYAHFSARKLACHPIQWASLQTSFSSSKPSGAVLFFLFFCFLCFVSLDFSIFYC